MVSYSDLLTLNPQLNLFVTCCNYIITYIAYNITNRSTVD